jgi:hypothetical protein
VHGSSVKGFPSGISGSCTQVSSLPTEGAAVILQALATRPVTLDPLGLHTSQEMFQVGALHPSLFMRQPRKHRPDNSLPIPRVWDGEDERDVSVGHQYLTVVDWTTEKTISAAKAGRYGIRTVCCTCL